MSTYEERLDILADHIMENLKDICSDSIRDKSPTYKVADICHVSTYEAQGMIEDAINLLVNRWAWFRRQEKEKLTDVSYIDEDFD